MPIRLTVHKFHFEFRLNMIKQVIHSPTALPDFDKYFTEHIGSRHCLLQPPKSCNIADVSWHVPEPPHISASVQESKASCAVPRTYLPRKKWWHSSSHKDYIFSQCAKFSQVATWYFCFSNLLEPGGVGHVSVEEVFLVSQLDVENQKGADHYLNISKKSYNRLYEHLCLIFDGARTERQHPSQTYGNTNNITDWWYSPTTRPSAEVSFHVGRLIRKSALTSSLRLAVSKTFLWKLI